MKKFLIFLSSFILGFVILCYFTFLLVPFFIKLDKYKPDIQKLVVENSKLNLDYSNIKLYTTPVLSAGVIIDDVKVKLPDNSTLFETPKIRAGIAIPSLLTLTVKTANCYVESPKINLEVENGEQYKIVKVIETIINENNSKPKEQPAEEPFIDINKITFKVPYVKITNYSAKISDDKINHSLTLSGENLVLGYNSKSNSVKVKTLASLYSDDNVNVTADVDIISSIPKIENSGNDVDPEEKIEIPFLNLIKIYQTYDFKANIISKLRIKHTEENELIARGFINIDNIKLKLSNIILPESYLHARFSGKTIDYNSNLYATKDELLSLDGSLKLGKKPNFFANIKSDKIQFTNLLALLKGLLDSLNIKNDIASIKASGYLTADASIKTNFKKLKSEGSILIKDGSFINYKNGIGIKDIAANLIFDNNILNIKETSATINNSKLTVEGKVDTESNASIKLNVNNLSLPVLYNAFAPKEIKKELLVNSALLTAHTNIEGKLDSLNANVKTTLNNFNICDRKKTIFLANNKADIDFFANSTEIKGEVNNKGFIFNMPSNKTTVKVENAKIGIDNEKISIKPFDLLFNNISKLNVKGEITNYLKNPDIDIFVTGGILTSSIKQSLGKEISYYLDSKGSIPSKISIKGNSKKQNIIAQVYTDSNNFITPVNIKEVAGLPTIMQADIKLQGNKIKIKNSGLFKKAHAGFSDNLEENMVNSVQLAELTASIDNNHINLLRINIPQELNGSLSVFKKSSFKTKGKINLNGYFDKIALGGDFKVWNINIPEIKTKLKNLDLNFSSQNLDLNARELNLNGSKINASLKTGLTPSATLKISDINIESNMINVDKMMDTVNELFKYMPPATSNSSSSSASNANIPIIADGKFNIKEIKTGNINIFNTKGNLSIKNNNLFIDRLTCKAFDGEIDGKIIVNLITQLITAKLSGKNVDADKLLVDTANLKNTISGIAKFKTNVSLKGATYNEQVKSLTGTVDFHLKDGVYGPFSKLQNFFLAENIRNNPIFANTIGVILNPLTTIDSSKYENLEGKLTFKDGVAYLDSIGSQGNILCVLIKGNMNLLTNEIESSVRVRLASSISDMLGPLAVANPVNLIKKTPGLNIATAKLFKIFTSVVTESEYNEIPDFSSKHKDANATKFQIVLKGDVAKPLKLVKSFKWLALQADMDKAEEFSTQYIKEQEDIAKQALINKLQKEYEDNNKIKVGVEKVLQMDTTAPAVKKVLVEEVVKKAQTKTTGTHTNQEALESAKQELKEQVKDAANKKAKEQINNLQEQLKAKAQAKAQAKAKAKTEANTEAATEESPQETNSTDKEQSTNKANETKDSTKDESEATTATE